MAHPINYYGQGMTPQESWETRNKMYDLYNDPDWMLQAGLGDIEFEQDMYDDIRYGGVSEEGAQFGDILGFADDSYDVTALAGLREHSTKGPNRYLDFTPLTNTPSEKYDTDKFGYAIDEPNYLARYNMREDAFGKGTGETTNIDINLPMHVNWWEHSGAKRGHELQNMISDTYRHEYKHSPNLTTHRNPYHHQAIFGQGAKYGLSPTARDEAFKRFMNPPTEDFPNVHYNPSRAAETSRDISSFSKNPFEQPSPGQTMGSAGRGSASPRPRPNPHLARGGIASLWHR